MSFVVGTAGHIDHGKSTLITALTGIDPDRLAEEKRRGMTIDLGFAHLTLPSGRDIGIVDVPGHVRFVPNMVAGVHGMDAVLLVVAADEGVMPQTLEHIEILDLLEVSRALVVLTKVDLAEPGWRELVTKDISEALHGTTLEGSEVVPVSAPAGIGLDELKAAIDQLVDHAEPRPDLGRPRLPIDRVFTMSGFGTVVTGTLVDGSLAVGDVVELVRDRKRVRIRGLQQHNTSVEVAAPGSRVAVNLIGVDKTDLERGDVLAGPDSLATTRRIDARVRVPAVAPIALRHGSELRLHSGTAEVQARITVIGGGEIGAGQEGWAQLYLDRAIAAADGDRFILRVPSPAMTLAGGRFTDVAPRKHARNDASVGQSLARRAAGDVLGQELDKHPRGMAAASFLKATHASAADLEKVAAVRAGDWLFSPAAWRVIAAQAANELAAYHQSYPLRAGMPREELKSRLGMPPAALAALQTDGVIADRGDVVALPSHATPEPAVDGPGSRLLEVLARTPFAPPSIAEALREAGAGPEVLRAMVTRGDLVRLSDEVAFTRDAYARAVALVKEVVAAEGFVTVAQLRDRLGASRRPILALLEHLDAERVTRRVGDQRVLR